MPPINLILNESQKAANSTNPETSSVLATNHNSEKTPIPPSSRPFEKELQVYKEKNSLQLQPLRYHATQSESSKRVPPGQTSRKTKREKLFSNATMRL